MEAILKEVNNYFYKTVEYSKFEIRNNKIKVKGNYFPNQFIKVENSIMNDGIYKIISFENQEIEIENTIDEEFEGAIYGLAIPKDFIELIKEIEEYQKMNPISKSNVISESYLNGYSYTMATNSNGQISGWQDVFKSKLDTYRRIYDGKRHAKEVR